MAKQQLDSFSLTDTEYEALGDLYQLAILTKQNIGKALLRIAVEKHGFKKDVPYDFEVDWENKKFSVAKIKTKSTLEK